MYFQQNLLELIMIQAVYMAQVVLKTNKIQSCLHKARSLMRRQVCEKWLEHKVEEVGELADPRQGVPCIHAKDLEHYLWEVLIFFNQELWGEWFKKTEDGNNYEDHLSPKKIWSRAVIARLKRI